MLASREVPDLQRSSAGFYPQQRSSAGRNQTSGLSESTETRILSTRPHFSDAGG